MAQPAPALAALLDKLRTRKAVVTPVGLGYVGLPLAAAFVDVGFRVLGYDIDQRKVDLLNRGQSYIQHLGPDLAQKLKATGRFEATSDASRLTESDAILLCVPTPLNKYREPDLTYVEKSSELVARTVRAGQLIILESTTYPGTTREITVPAIEKVAATRGLVVGRDVFVAYSPEREDPGNKGHSVRDIPKVVGGHGPEALEAAVALYSAISPRVVPVSSCEAAESSKLLENIYRSVNIALVNELKVIFDKMGIDVWEVIEAAKTKPFGFQAFYPGPGLGGHCIPIDPFYLTWKAREYGYTTRFIELAGEVNSKMPRHVVDCLAMALNDQGKPMKGSKVLVMGVAYKKNVDDPRETPAAEIITELEHLGCVVSYHDPHIPVFPRMRAYEIELSNTPLTREAVAAADAVFIVTDHDAVDYQLLADHAKLIVDTRNAMARVRSPKAPVIKA